MRCAVLALLAAGGGAADANAQSPDGGRAIATFAGGRFWGLEPAYDQLAGVIATTAGYTGGHVEDPTYEEVSAGGTGHFEALRVSYDPGVIGYAELLEVYWRNIDPLDEGGQFCDRGFQYRSAIFVHDDEQERLARRAKQALGKSGVLPESIVTPILPAQTFYPAKEDHQDYYLDHPLRYRFYRFTCGRDGRLEELWSSVNLDEILPPKSP